jgi:NAD(P)-dependent dehydrogenase (short-subunit alcohol dehydrogenase family)
VDMNLKGRTILVTGASKGIGLSVAQWFAREGCNLRLAARSGDAMEKAAAVMRRDHGVDVQCMALDLSKESERKKAMDAWPDIDVLVNNAGDIPAGGIDDISDEAWRAGWDLKVFGYLSFTRFYYSKFKARKKGVIINIIGSAGERPSAGYLAGSMGNVSLMGMTLALGAESPKFGVRVVGVNPGPIMTDRVKKLGAKRAEQMLGDASRYEEFYVNYPFGRPGTVDEVSPMVVLLASDHSSYTSGTIITINGGLSARSAG